MLVILILYTYCCYNFYVGIIWLGPRIVRSVIFLFNTESCNSEHIFFANVFWNFLDYYLIESARITEIYKFATNIARLRWKHRRNIVLQTTNNFESRGKNVGRKSPRGRGKSIRRQRTRGWTSSAITRINFSSFNLSSWSCPRLISGQPAGRTEHSATRGPFALFLSAEK